MIKVNITKWLNQPTYMSFDSMLWEGQSITSAFFPGKNASIKSSQEEISDNPQVKDILQNNWATLFKCKGHKVSKYRLKRYSRLKDTEEPLQWNKTCETGLSLKSVFFLFLYIFLNIKNNFGGNL